MASIEFRCHEVEAGLFQPRIYALLGESLVPEAESCWQRALAGLRRRCGELGHDLFSINGDLTEFGTENFQGHSGHSNRKAALTTLLGPGDVIVAIHLAEPLAMRLLDHGVSIILLTEADLRHPRCSSPVGFYEMARTVGIYLAERLTTAADGRRTVLAVGGMMDPGEAGRSRLTGISDGLREYPAIRLEHVPTPTWHYDLAIDGIRLAMRIFREPIGAVFGLADPLALAARDVGIELGVVDDRTLLVGVDGDPMAWSAIAAGEMTATVDIGAYELGERAGEIAHRAIAGDVVPPHFPYHWRWVDAHEVRHSADPIVAPARSGPPTNNVVKRAIAYIHRRYARPFARREMAEALGVQEHYLSRVFARQVGTSLWEYVNWYRIECAKELLKRPAGRSVAAVARHVGFADAAYFSRVFRRHAGCSPREYLREQANVAPWTREPASASEPTSTGS